MGKDVNEATSAFFDGDVEKAEDRLEDTAETIEDKVGSPIVRTALLELLEALGSVMGL
ncbi:MAG TPA: hypothetical protein VLG28_10635 [Acidimicrobiia bacterium]|nr:hypothetical protein [Acidimicrobiia bacterium]